MSDSLNKFVFLIVIFFLVPFNIKSQSSSLILYSYKDVWIVFPDFCVEDFHISEFGGLAVDTFYGIGIDVDGFSPFPLFQSGDYPPNNLFYKLPLYSLNGSGQKSPFSHFTISVKTQHKSSTITTLSIGKIELWHDPPVPQKSYPFALKQSLDKYLTGEEFLALITVFHIFDCNEDIYSVPLRVNFFKLINEIYFPDLVNWANEMCDKIEFHPINCPHTTMNFLKYNPCNWSETE